MELKNEMNILWWAKECDHFKNQANINFLY